MSSASMLSADLAAAAPARGRFGVLVVPGAAGLARLAAADPTTSPFQHRAWMRAYLAAQGALDDFRLIELADGAGGALHLPLRLTRWNGLALGRKVGDSHASFLAPLRLGDVSGWNAAMVRDGLARAGRMAGFDALLLADCPLSWAGVPNPLAQLPGQSAPSSAAMLTIAGGGEAVLDRLFDREARKKQRYKRRKLAEFGPLASGWAPCNGTAERALDAFFTWKARQFAVLGVPDPFRSEEVRAFLREACCGQTVSTRLFVLHVGGAPAAVIGTTPAGSHVSGMFTAYNPDPALSRFSPGDVAMSDLLLTLAAEGAAGFDLGVGEARYKNHFCPEPVALVDIALGANGRGAIAAAAWRGLRRIKRMIKQNPQSYAAAMDLRRRLMRGSA